MTDPEQATEALAALIGSVSPTGHVYVKGNDACQEVARAVLAAGWTPPADVNAPGLRGRIYHECRRCQWQWSDDDVHPSCPDCGWSPPRTDGLASRIEALADEWIARNPEKWAKRGAQRGIQAAREAHARELRALLVTQPDKACDCWRSEQVGWAYECPVHGPPDKAEERRMSAQNCPHTECACDDSEDRVALGDHCQHYEDGTGNCCCCHANPDEGEA